MEEAFRALLTGDAGVAALCSTRVYWDEIPQAASAPLVVLFRISGVPDYSTAGATGLVMSRVQANCRADTKAAAIGLARAVEAKLSGFSGTQSGIRFKPILLAMHRSRFVKPDAAESYYVEELDFEIWHGLSA